MADLVPLPATALRKHCTPDSLGFDTTEALADHAGDLGQERAVEAIRFGLAMGHTGYHVFVLGEAGSGKHATTFRLLRERGKNAYADAVAHAGGMPVDFRYQYEPKGLGHAIRSAADAVAGENFLVLLGDYVVPNRDICDKMLAVSKEHGGASVIAVAACSPEEVSRYGVIAGERVGSLEGAEGVADAEPGAVWRIGGLVEKPAPEAAPSNLYIVGRYLLSPLVMDLLADQQAGKGGEIQLTDAMARSLDREAMYAVVIDPLSGYDTGTPSGWIATNALMAASDPRFASAFWDAIDERGGLMRK